jgi:Uma2 family endonuclease
MATVSTRLLTAEEFSRLPQPADGSKQELVQGVVITMPPPGGRHGVCCLKIGRKVGNFVEEHHLGTVTCNDAGFIIQRDPDTVRGPDIAFWSRDRLTEIPAGYIAVPPDLAVEVVSPDDHFARVHRKATQYLKSGVRLVWVVDPEDRSLTVYRPPDKFPEIFGENEVVSGEDVLAGFSCRVADLLL